MSTNLRMQWTFGLLAGLAAACGGTDPGEAVLSKGDVEGGKGDHSVDYCAKYGWYDDGVCDDFCAHPDPDCECSPVLCELYCEDGFQVDDDGCEICACAEPAGCPPVLCELFCANGFVTGEDGCPVCECADPEECAPVLCELFCENGFKTNENGCETCECADAPTTCGGHLGATCGIDEFCAYELEDICGATDHLGTCRARPEVCAQVLSPVCGCDGQTYDNACEANSNGTSAASNGECAAADCREEGCGQGEDCSFCWGTWQCIPDGAQC